jgi:N-acetylglucosamine kinase-like BadF-type ATPase
MTLALGVDVGNSKTHVVATDTHGRVVGAATGPGWISGDLTAGTAVDHVLGLAERACGHRSGFAAAALAVAGLDLPGQEEEMTERVIAAGLAGRVTVVNDTFALLRTGSESRDGVAVVAGAGINCVGVRGDRVVRFHSMGRLSGDWGGGYDVGREALALACRSEDGRDGATLLRTRVPEHFGLTRPLEVTEAVVSGRLREDRLLELAPVVFAAAGEGDAAATSIVQRLADEVAAFARTALRRLDWGRLDRGRLERGRLDRADEPVPLVLGGGLLQSADAYLVGSIREALADVAPGVDLRVSDVPPVVGAVLMALDLLDSPAPDAAALAAAVRAAL